MQSDLIAAMENTTSPTTSTSLLGKVFHTQADIRIDSIEDLPRNIDGAIPASKLIEHHSQTTPKDEENDDPIVANLQREWWNEAITKNMGLNDGYNKVAVLLIKWDDGLDELKTAAETKELRDLFADQFHYSTQIVELNVSSKPQHQMHEFITTFLRTHDGPNNLMIVYYTGHGEYHEHGKFLGLTASINPSDTFGFKIPARVNWNRAEDLLRTDDVDGDVLTILDTCYSSNVQKSGVKEQHKTFELLSACAYDTTTACPGPNSFTRALIDALKELLAQNKDQSFNTFRLNQRVNMNPNRRDTQSQLWSRLGDDNRHISLAPLKPSQDRGKKKDELFKPPQGYLTLRFALRQSTLNQEQIEFLAGKIATAFSNKALLGLRRIDWLGLKPVRPTSLQVDQFQYKQHFGRAALAMYAITRWKKYVRGKKKMVEGQENGVGDDGGEVEEVKEVPKFTRKRTIDELDEGGGVLLPASKRGSLGVLPPSQGNPPSPPVSTSSRVEELHDEHGDADVEMS